MRHDEKHAAIAAYAWWSKLEHTGQLKHNLATYYTQLYNCHNDMNLCTACVIALQKSDKREQNICDCCPCKWAIPYCTDFEKGYCEAYGAEFYNWKTAIMKVMATSGDNMQQMAYHKETKIAAGDIANVMRRWCEDLGIIAKRGE